MPEISYGLSIPEIKEAIAYYWQVSIGSVTHNMNGRYSTAEQPKRITDGRKEGGD